MSTAKHLHRYPSIYAMGHGALVNLFTGPVVVQEKIDGSQFSFGVVGGELQVRSKGCTIVLESVPQMFQSAVNTVLQIQLKLKDGWVYRGEVLNKPKHNTLNYDRVPTGNIIIFDINTNLETYLSPKEVQSEANALGLETVPYFYMGIVTSHDQLKDFMKLTSCLGGPTIEGYVVKNYLQFTRDGKAVMGKYVGEQFKEMHKKEWKKTSPSKLDVLENLKLELTTEARWEKAVQHLRDSNLLKNEPADIGPLLKEMITDTHNECEDYIKQQLFKWAWPHISRSLGRGFPQWYKNKLLETQVFDGTGKDMPC